MSGGERRTDSRAARIYHLTTDDAWTEALAQGVYRLSTRGLTLGEVGFIHCSYANQVTKVADLLYSDVPELLLLVIDPRRSTSPLRAENLEGGEELFPHLYGPLDPAAVERVIRMERGEDRRFRLPADLHPAG